jgi:hypothetical protein
MPRNLTAVEQATVESKRQANKPSVYDPRGKSPTAVSKDFETWLILTGKTPKDKVITQIKELQKAEADEDYQALLKETLDAEQKSLKGEMDDLSSRTDALETWRKDPGVAGFEDVAEIGWMTQELQQGSNPVSEKEELDHFEALRAACGNRLIISKDSTGDRTTRLNAWLAALNSY